MRKEDSKNGKPKKKEVRGRSGYRKKLWLEFEKAHKDLQLNIQEP